MDSKSTPCSVTDCERLAVRRQWCFKHYQQWRRSGRPEPITPWERFLSHIEIQSNGCWYWTGTLTKGYGTFGYQGTRIGAHKFAYQFKYGPVPKGLVLDHIICDTPCCANPDHVTPTTNRDNVWRSEKFLGRVNASKTECVRGHELSQDNIWVYPTPSGTRRVCKRCTAIRSQESKLRSG